MFKVVVRIAFVRIRNLYLKLSKMLCISGILNLKIEYFHCLKLFISVFKTKVFYKHQIIKFYMKHTLKITLILVFFFLISQIIGLAITNKYIDHKATDETGKVVFKALPYNVARPVVEESTSFTYIIAAVLIGTLLVFLLMKFKKVIWWKVWFFLSVWLVLTVAFSAVLKQDIALFLALFLAIWKIFKPNIIIHNLTEIFIYGGLAAILVPMMNIFAGIMLLLLISIYDMIAVWKSKHMIKLAKFQTKSKVFAGLFIPYSTEKKVKKGVPVKVKKAILGGGDIGFPLIFAGIVMKRLMLSNIALIGFLKSLIIPFIVSIALLILFIKGEHDKFYPAMPFLSVGCMIGYLIVLLI